MYCFHSNFIFYLFFFLFIFLFISLKSLQKKNQAKRTRFSDISSISSCSQAGLICRTGTEYKNPLNYLEAHIQNKFYIFCHISCFSQILFMALTDICKQLRKTAKRNRFFYMTLCFSAFNAGF